MEWLSQNWIWILFVVGMFLMMRHGGMGCGMGHQHHGGGKPPTGTQGDAKADRAADQHRGCC